MAKNKTSVAIEDVLAMSESATVVAPPTKITKRNGKGKPKMEAEPMASQADLDPLFVRVNGLDEDVKTVFSALARLDQKDRGDPVLMERLQRIEEESKLLFKRSHAVCAMGERICPEQFEIKLHELQVASDFFRDGQDISIWRAIEIQATFSESLALTISRETAALYRLCRFSLEEQRQIYSAAELGEMLVGDKSTILAEFSHISLLVEKIRNENPLKDNMSLSTTSSQKTSDTGYWIEFS
jgi:hypothetical protein